MFEKIFINIYRIWHGRLHLRGAGRMISYLATRSKGLQAYPLELPNGYTTIVDFRELSAFGWLNTILGDETQEDKLIKAICENLNTNSVFWDIGANAGILSYLVAERSDTRESRFFEPNPKLYPWATAALSHLPKVIGHNLGISNSAGLALLRVPVNKSAYGSIGAGVDGEVEEFEVQIRTADSLVYDLGYLPPSVVKIDTEGHEPAVFEGMSKILSEHRPIVFFEHIELSDEEIVAMIPEGYELKTVSNMTGELAPKFDRKIGHNSAFIPR